MGAGVSQKVMNGYYYRRLKKLQRELEAAGVACQYGRFQLFGVKSGVWATERSGAFRVSYDTLRASNGETCGMMHVSVAVPLDGSTGFYGSTEFYGKNWDSEKGIARIKQLFGKQTTEATCQ